VRTGSEIFSEDIPRHSGQPPPSIWSDSAHNTSNPVCTIELMDHGFYRCLIPCTHCGQDAWISGLDGYRKPGSDTAGGQYSQSIPPSWRRRLWNIRLSDEFVMHVSLCADADPMHLFSFSPPWRPLFIFVSI